MISIRIGSSELLSEIKIDDVIRSLQSKKFRKKILNIIRQSDNTSRNRILMISKPEEVIADLVSQGGSEQSAKNAIAVLTDDHIKKMIQAFTSLIHNATPDDITDTQKGVAANWIKSMLLVNNRDIERLWISARSVSEIYDLHMYTYRQRIESFFQMQHFIPRDFPKDLMAYNTYQQLRSAIAETRPIYQKYLDQKAYEDAEQGIEEIYEDDDWKVTAVHNKGAACELGKGTDWCTAAPGLDYFSHYYSEDNPLFVFVNKKDPREKYQFHYGSDQYMDKNDRYVEFEEVMVPLHHLLLKGGAHQKYPKILDSDEYTMPDPKMYKETGDSLVVTGPHGIRYHYKNGKLHNETGPAVEDPTVTKRKIKGSRYYNPWGGVGRWRYIPGKEIEETNEQYWLNGKKYTPERWAAEVDKMEDEEYHGWGLKESVREPINLKSFKVKDTLNPDIWQNNQLSSQVSLKLRKIVNDFLDSLEIPRDMVRDITFTGSLANYNWSRYSDIDLHIILDFADIDENVELVKKFFDSKRLEWNKTHNIKIKDHEVEIYVQQADEPHHSTGVYSIMGDKWLTEPTKQAPHMDEEEIERKSDYVIQEIEEVSRLYRKGKYDEAFRYAEKLKARIRDFRKCGLEEGGEFSTENIVFKALRRSGHLDWLSEIKTKAYDKLMSLDEAEGGYSTGGQSGGWLPDDPSGWMDLRDNIIDEYPGSEVSAVYDENKNQLKIYKIAVAKNLRNQGIGSEIMEKITDWADSIHALIILTPATDFGASSVNRLIKFYKRFGFVDNKGRKKDFSISDTMYRKPQ